MTTAITSHQCVSRGDGPEGDHTIGLNVYRLWSYLCAVGTLLDEPSLASLAREIPKIELMRQQPPQVEWAVMTLLEIPETGWAWEIPAALAVVAEIAAHEEVAGPLDERLRAHTGRFGRIVTYYEGPYAELAELVMKKLGERQQATRAAADIAAGR